MIQIPSEEHFGNVFGFTTPPESGGDSLGFFNILNIVVKRDSQNTVNLNGAPIFNHSSALSSEIPNTDYNVIRIEVPKGEGLYNVEQTDLTSSPLSVIVYGYEFSESYGYSAGLSLPSNKRLLSFLPFYFREMGGEGLSVTLPCVQASNSSDDENPKCQFENGGGDVLVTGDRSSAYTIHCVTPTFYHTGLTHVYVSLDNGRTFVYSGNIYVASQEDFPPLLTVEQENSDGQGGVIDLDEDDPIILSWDPAILGDDVSHVDIVVNNFDVNNNGMPVLSEEETTVVSGVANNGTITILPQLVRFHFEDKRLNNSNTVTPLTRFSLVPSKQRKRRSILKSLVVHGGVLITSYALDCETYDNVLAKRADEVPPCPCTFTQANVDANFQLSNHKLDFFHPGAANCFRGPSSTTASGQQCCYGEDGNIIVGPPGGGTADRYSPDGVVSTTLHFFYDVAPWFACCKLSNQCDKYYEHRPSDDCSEYDPPRPARATGDPHMTTLDGKQFTFNGAGEFLMIFSVVESLTFQARMERYHDTMATVYTALVIQTNNSVKVQVERLSTNETSVLVNNEPLHISSSPIRIHKFDGVQISSTNDASELKVVFRAGVTLIIYMQADIMSFITQLNEKFQGRIHGLLGNYNGDPEDDFQFPNGTNVQDVSSLGKIHEYALEWMLTVDESIFTYIPPYDYNTYHMPDFIPILDLPNLNNVNQEIKDACGDSLECIFDAVTTGSLSFANKTLANSATFDIIQKSSVKLISCGFPGTVTNGHVSGHVYLVNSTVHVSCDDNFVLDSSSPMITCKADGHWSSDLPLCVVPEQTVSSQRSTTLYVIVGAVAAFVIAIVVAIFVCFKMKKPSAVSSS